MVGGGKRGLSAWEGDGNAVMVEWLSVGRFPTALRRVVNGCGCDEAF
jgi:hypothetical protein